MEFGRSVETKLLGGLWCYLDDLAYMHDIGRVNLRNPEVVFAVVEACFGR